LELTTLVESTKLMKTENKLKRTILIKGKSFWPLFAIMAAGAVFATWLGLTTRSVQAGPEFKADVVVHKSPACGCCSLWINQLKANGLEVEVVNVASTEGIRQSLNVPSAARSCHTAEVGDYWVEGHVPVDLIAYLIDEKPSDISGLAVPGMAIGSPGMEGPNATEYEVLAYDLAGNASVYATRQGKTTAQ
jgi:hypothetical protein